MSLPRNCEHGTVTKGIKIEPCIMFHVTKIENANNQKCILDAIFTKNDIMFAFAGEPNEDEQDRLIRFLSSTGPYRISKADSLCRQSAKAFSTYKRALAASESILK